MRAAEQGDLREVQTLIDAGAEVNATDQRGLTALMYAVYGNRENFRRREDVKNREDVINLLIKNRADIGKKHRGGSDALSCTGARCQGAIIYAITTAGGASDSGSVAAAIKSSGCPELTEAITTRVSSATPLMRAAARGDSNGIRTLIASGADPNVVDERGMTPLIYAVMTNREDVVRELLSRRVDVNRKDNRGRDAHYWAGYGCNKSIIQALTAAGGGHQDSARAS